MTGDNVDLHLSVLATWFVRTLGRAIIWAVLGSFVTGLLLAIAVHPVLGWIVGTAAGPAIFAWRLMDATAPLPDSTWGE